MSDKEMEEFNLLGIDGVSEYAHSSAPNTPPYSQRTPSE